MVMFGRKLELINVQQAGKKEISKVLNQEATNKIFKAIYLAKKSGKTHITDKEIETTLKTNE
jgi:hypothetical protein